MIILKASNNVDALKEVTTLLEKQLDEMKSKLDEVIPKPKPYVKLPDIYKYSLQLGNAYSGEKIHLNGYPSAMLTIKDFYGNTVDTPTEQQFTERLKTLFSLLDNYEKDCEAVIAQNKEIQVYNQAIAAKVNNIMKELGVPDTYYTKEYKSPRSTKATEVKHSAGYLGDLQRLLGTPPQPSVNVASKRKELQAEYDKRIRGIQEAQRKLAQEEAKRKAEQDLMLLRAKYTPDDSGSDKYAVLNAIISKNKYLYLAHHLEVNRNDWSDGYDYAERGLDGFTIETLEDEEIYKEIRSLIDDSDYVDGRVFRDCNYSYSHLYGLVEDAQLLKDHQKITTGMMW